MSEQQQTSLHRWEIVCQGGQGENANTYRMRVPGDWLYRYQPNITPSPARRSLGQD
jgi:hypothetical protein